MGRLIDADALKERALRVSTVKEHCYMKAVGTHEIDKAPTVDAVPVVRCKNCVHLVKTEDGEYNPEDCVCDYWMTDGLWETDFCSYGERKEEL